MMQSDIATASNALEDDAIDLDPELRGGGVVGEFADEGVMQGLGTGFGAESHEDCRRIEDLLAHVGTALRAFAVNRWRTV
jgi:hypothetical protein